MVFFFVCYEHVLLPLVNKEAVLANGLAEQSQVGNLNRGIERERIDGVRRYQLGAEAEEHAGTLGTLPGKSQPHGNMRLIEMG